VIAPRGPQRARRQRADHWMERGAADALVRLFGSRRLRPTVTFAEAAKIAGVSEHAAREAINRLQRTHRPKPRRRNAPGPAPAGTKWCGYGEHFPCLEDFAPNRSATTGRQSWCRSCTVLARRKQRERQAERVQRHRSAA
jgi:hypothetical protein